MSVRKKIFIVFVVFAGILALYWASTYFAAYTDDAYVNADLIRVTPVIDGLVTEVHVTDDQTVEAGAALVTIDPKPFRLQLEICQAVVDQAEQTLRAKNHAAREAKAMLDKASSAHELAVKTMHRYEDLKKSGNVSRQKYDEVAEELSIQAANLEKARESSQEALQAVAAQKARIVQAKAELGLARYQLDHARILAPADGHITALTLRPGDYAKKGDPLIGMVDRESWRIVANFRERLVRHIHPGQRALVYLDGHPWRILNGTVRSVGRGVARKPGDPGLLPYVKPTTNWVRLSRRFPVTIVLDEIPETLRLHKGADARVLVIY